MIAVVKVNNDTSARIKTAPVNGSGIRDTARVLQISPKTVMSELKKAQKLQAVNQAQLAQLEPKQRIVCLCQWEDLAAEADEMWSYVQRKSQQRWLWHAIDHQTGKILAYVLADHKDVAFLQLKARLEPFGISQYYTDDWGAYHRHLIPAVHIVGKRNTQKIERKHLTLRTRIKRLVHHTICFSKTIVMYDMVVGIFINRYEFSLMI
jgi:insertion element IS1 protein InsB